MVTEAPAACEPAQVQASPAPRAPWLFTSERAAQLNRERAAARKAARANGTFVPPPRPVVLPDANQSPWVKERITRIRGQLRALDISLDAAVEAGNARDIERIVSAISRLAEIERKLDNRPDPGQRRPGRDKARPTSPLSGLAAPTPAEADPPQAADAAPSPEPISPSHSEPLPPEGANAQDAA